jgi:hypothetical protein
MRILPSSYETEASTDKDAGKTSSRPVFRARVVARH